MQLLINGRFLLQDVTGVQRVAVEFVEALDAALVAGRYPDLDVEVVLPRRGELRVPVDYRAVRIRRAGWLSGHLWEQFELPRMAGRAALLCLGNTAPVSSLLRGDTKVFTMIHDLSYRYVPQAYTRRFRFVYRMLIPVVLSRSEHVFTVSRSEAEQIRRHHPRLIDDRRLTVAQNGGLPDRLLDPGIEAERPMNVPPRALYVGSLTQRKNAAGLLEAIRLLVARRRIRFTIIGATGGVFTSKRGVDEAATSDEVCLLGQLNDVRLIQDEYRRSDVFVFPSFYEASPLPPIEAMQSGCVVVCSDIPSLRERCGDAAVYVDPHDVEAIVAGVTRVLDDAALRIDLRLKGAVHAAGYTWSAQVDHVLAVIGGLARPDPAVRL